MQSTDTRETPQISLLRSLSTERMPGHWLLASLGKLVLRPGRLEVTTHLLDQLGIGHRDDGLELAPGLGVTARLTFDWRPRSYSAGERDERPVVKVSELPRGTSGRFAHGNAECTGLVPRRSQSRMAKACSRCRPCRSR